jgi:hypothetical protein
VDCFSSAVHNCQNQLFLLTLALLQRAHQILNRQRLAFLNAQNQVLGCVFAVGATFINAKIDSPAKAFPDDVAAASQISINQVVNPSVIVNGFVASEKESMLLLSFISTPFFFRTPQALNSELVVVFAFSLINRQLLL